MGDAQNRYWDVDECRWVLCDAPSDEVTVPSQSAAGADGQVSEPREADVRSG